MPTDQNIEFDTIGLFEIPEIYPVNKSENTGLFLLNSVNGRSIELVRTIDDGQQMIWFRNGTKNNLFNDFKKYRLTKVIDISYVIGVLESMLTMKDGKLQFNDNWIEIVIEMIMKSNTFL